VDIYVRASEKRTYFNSFRAGLPMNTKIALQGPISRKDGEWGPCRYAEFSIWQTVE
jgi:hypothetical protein